MRREGDRRGASLQQGTEEGASREKRYRRREGDKRQAPLDMLHNPQPTEPAPGPLFEQLLGGIGARQDLQHMAVHQWCKA